MATQMHLGEGTMETLSQVHTLTFDVFGTILDLEGSLSGPIEKFLQGKNVPLSSKELWARWRSRQRIEQYQDNLLFMGHPGYLDAARRALIYVLRQTDIPFTEQEIPNLMEAWRKLWPFHDVIDGLNRLRTRFRLVVLSNGNSWFLEHLAKNCIKFDFDQVISVETVGVFKPHPATYRMAKNLLKAEPQEIMMVSSNSFDVMGARCCGFRGAWVDRYKLPFEETPFRPDIQVRDFIELADRLYS